jgi:hypothetical protein
MANFGPQLEMLYGVQVSCARRTRIAIGDIEIAVCRPYACCNGRGMALGAAADGHTAALRVPAQLE